MNRRPVVIALALVVISVILQTTLFGDGRIQIFGAAPLVVLAVVIGCVRYLEAEPALLLGFTAGLFLDLLGGSPLGLWAIVHLVIAYIVLRVRERFDDGAASIALGVFLLTMFGQVLFLLETTLFGQRLLAAVSPVTQILLPALYTMIVSAAIVPGISRLLRDSTMGAWTR